MITALSLLLLVLSGSVNATVANSQISLATTSIFSDAGLGERSLFYAQSRFWLFYPSGSYVIGVSLILVDVFFVSSSDGVTWTSPAKLGIASFDINGGALTHDDDHIYVALATSDSIYLAYGQLNSNGTVTMNTEGGRLKLAAPEGSSGGVTMSIGVSSDLHIFIAYQAVYGCGLCVTDSAYPPYTSWTVSLRMNQRVNYPQIHPYRRGQMLLVSGDYSNVWSNGWGSPAFLSGNDGVGGEQLLYLDGLGYLFSNGADCPVPGRGLCMGFRIFDGTSWSTLQATNVRMLFGNPPFTVTYERQGHMFVAFTFNIQNSTIVYQWSANIHSNYYSNKTVATGRDDLYSIGSFETSVSRGPGTGIIGVAWTETGHFPSKVYTYISR